MIGDLMPVAHMLNAYGRRVPDTEFHRQRLMEEIARIRARCAAYDALPWYRRLLTRKPYGYTLYWQGSH